MALVRAESFEKISTSTGTGSETDVSEYLTKNYNRSDWTNGGEPQLHSGRLNTNSLSLGSGVNADQNWIEIPTGNVGEIIFGFAYRPPKYRGANQNDWIEFWEYTDQSGDTLQVEFEVQDTSFIVRRGNSGRIAEQVGAFNQNIWNHIEIRIVFDDTAGELDVKVNGDLLVSKTGLDTNNGGNDKCDVIRIHGVETQSSDDEDLLGLIDDLYVLDTTGAVTNGSIAPNLVVEALLPTSDGDTIQWTPSSGDNYTNVDDEEPNTADYNSSSTLGQIDLFNMQSLTHVGGTIYGVEVRNVFIADAPGLVSIKPKIKENVTVGTGDATHTVESQSYTDATHVFTINPDTSAAWTVTEVNNMQCGYEVG